MQVDKKDLGKSQLELVIILSAEEFAPYVKKGAENLAQVLKIEGFRPGKAPYEIVKSKVGEMAILEEGAHIAINKTLAEAFKDIDRQVIGQPDISISKLAPNNPLEYKAVISLVPEVTLGAYKDLQLVEKKVEVKDEEVARALAELSEMNVKETIAEREAQDSDKILVDIDMYLDNVPVEGGQNKGTAVILGKDYIIPGFDKKIIGAKKGDVREFSLSYPTEFHMKNLAGKMVEFKVKVNEIYARVLPEQNDELAKMFHFKNLDDLKDNIKKSIEHGKGKEIRQALEIEILDKIAAKTKFGDLSEMLVQHEVDAIMNEMEAEIEKQGGKFGDYLESIKKSRGDLMLDATPNAIKRVKTALLVREIAIKEKMTVETKEVEDYLEHQKSHHKNDSAILEKLSSPEYKNYAMNVLVNRKVIEKLREWNIAK
jgi:trigger factor